MRLALLLCVVGCAHLPPPPPLDPLPPVDLAALAARLDRPVEPLWPRLPRPLREAVERSVSPPAGDGERLAAARKRLDQVLDSLAGNPGQRVAEGIYLAEPIAFSQSSPHRAAAAALLARTYGRLSFWAGERVALGMLSQVFSALEYRMVAALPDILGEASDGMWRHLGALVLRESRSPAEIGDVLQLMARDADSNQRLEEARDLRVAALERRPGNAWEWLELADAAYVVFDLKRGDQALANARRALASQAGPRARPLARAKMTEETRLQAAEALRLAGATALDDRLTRIERLCQLGQIALAERELAPLLATPTDARPRTLQVMLRYAHLGHGLDLIAAGDLASELERLDSLPDRDRLHWSLRIGLLGIKGTSLFASDPGTLRFQMTDLVQRLTIAANGLKAYDAGRAAVLLEVTRIVRLIAEDQKEDSVKRALPEALRVSRGLAERYPRTADSHYFRYATLALENPPDFAALETRPPLSPDEAPALYLERARTHLGLVLRFAPRRLSQTRRLIDEVVERGDERGGRSLLIADVMAVEALASGSRRDWARAAAAYERAAHGQRDSDTLPRLNNNWGYALIHSGARAQGLERLARAVSGSEEKWVPLLNIAVASHDSDGERLKAVVDVTFGEGVRAAAWAWRAWLHQRAGDHKAAVEHARWALDSLDTNRVEGQLAWGQRGALVVSSFQLSLGLPVRTSDYGLTIKVDHNPWLIEPSPLDEAGLRRLLR